MDRYPDGPPDTLWDRLLLLVLWLLFVVSLLAAGCAADPSCYRVSRVDTWVDAGYGQAQVSAGSSGAVASWDTRVGTNLSWDTSICDWVPSPEPNAQRHAAPDATPRHR